MSESNKQKRKNSKLLKTVLKGVTVTLVVCVCAILVLKNSGLFIEKSEPVIITKSLLMEAVDISDLWTAEYRYNGIGKNSKKGCYISYGSTVKAGYNIKEVSWEIDEANKTVIASLPEVILSVYLDDKYKMSVIPNDSEISVSEMRGTCEKDALKEAQKSNELLNMAEENFKDTIEGLVLPILQPNGYSLAWSHTELSEEE